MSGNIRGKIECFLNEGSAGNNAQAFFKNLYDFFAAHPQMTLIARQAGSGKPAANTGYYDAGDAFGNNAWAVYRMNSTSGSGGPRAYDYYVLIQYSDPSTFGTAPGNPGQIGASTGGGTGNIGIQVAIGVGGDGNPWKGTGITMGAHTKGNPVWGAPSGGTLAHVFPRSNNAGGSHTASRENCAWLMVASGGATPKYRGHVVADDDSIVIVGDDIDDNTYTLTHIGPYTVRQGLSMTYPLVMMSTGGTILPFSRNTPYGTTLGSGYNQGGAIHRDDGIGVRQVYMDRLTDICDSAVIQPNRIFAVPEFDEFPVPIYINETPHTGFIGQIDFIREVANIATHDTSADRKRMIVGSTTLSNVKVSMPWDGTTTPKSGITRQGLDFVRPGP